MVKVLELAKLSRYTYWHKDLPLGWRVYKNSSQIGYSKDGYYGIVFINDNAKEIVFASSGTSLYAQHGLEDLKKDLLSNWQILKGEVPAQFTEAAWPFTKEIIKQLGASINNYKIYFTGHSLGAVLAELCKFSLNINSKAITFDSPGTREIIENMTAEPVVGKINGIISYNGDENAINTCNQPAGIVYKVKIECEDLEESNEFNSPLQEVSRPVREMLEQHSIDNIIASLERAQFEPNIVEKVEEWEPGFICSSVKAIDYLASLYQEIVTDMANNDGPFGDIDIVEIIGELGDFIKS